MALRHPLHDVAVVGVYNTEQARSLAGRDSMSVAFEAAFGALDDAGMSARDLDGVVGAYAKDFVYQTRGGPVWSATSIGGIPTVMEASAAIATGLASRVLIFGGSAGLYTDHAATAPWTRPTHEFVASYGMFTAAEFALIARRHMHLYGTTPEALATVAATIRNNGHVNPEAVYYDRGPFVPQDVLDSRLIADPYHLLDCSTTSEGGCAILLARSDLANDLRQRPVYVLGGNTDQMGPSYRHPPSYDLGGNRRSDLVAGTIGRRAAEESFRIAGITTDDVDVCEFYDPFSFEIIRQLEAFGFCGEGEGGDFVLDGNIAPGGRYPVTTDGGLMSFSHSGVVVQLLQRVIRGVAQLRGSCPTMQVPGAEVAMCSGGGAGALFTDVMLLGTVRP